MFSSWRNLVRLVKHKGGILLKTKIFSVACDRKENEACNGRCIAYKKREQRYDICPHIAIVTMGAKE